jgi:hypothetical protein
VSGHLWGEEGVIEGKKRILITDRNKTKWKEMQ